MISLQTLDRKIWRKDKLVTYLFHCHTQNLDALIDLSPEGSCAEALGLYRVLDEFCLSTGYSKSRIIIKTANMVEQHSDYQIIKEPEYWYEITAIQQWLQDKILNIQYIPSKHFANFTSRSNWFRLWVATMLDTYYRDKTVQTYHYDPERENYNYNGYLGVDDLFKYKCNYVTEAVNFLKTCPRTIDLDYLTDLNNTKGSLYQHENSYYPIQYPSNLNLLQYYNDIFVDIVAEPNISGNCFLVTEKLWRTIVAKRPFIVVSNVDYLKNLRKLGFKTFGNWWDESYDMYGGGNRINEVEKILNKISTCNLGALEYKLNEMQDVLEHNYQTFMNLSYYDIIKEFN